MPITDLDAYRSALSEPRELLTVSIPAVTAIAGRLYDLWTPAVPVGVAPTTAVVPTRATAGALGQQNGGGSLTLGLIAAMFDSRSPGVYIVADRLSHQGGLSGIVTGSQTTNLPTAALTRYTTGDGVMAALTIYTVIGTTGTTVTMSYTDEAGNTGNTSPAFAIGATGFREVPRMLLMPLASDDSGVRAVADVNLVGTTGTAGNFGVTLFRPLYAVIVDTFATPVWVNLFDGNMCGGVPEIVDDACLFVLAVGSASTSIQGQGVLLTMEH